MKAEFADRLIKHINFLEEELKDHAQFERFTRDDYLKNRDKRRNIERWIENIINSTVDISRVILSIEEKPIPDTYREIVLMISTIEGLERLDTDKLAKWVKFRNIIAHEYLDIKWNSISKFIVEVEAIYSDFSAIIKEYSKHKFESA
ncbi:MAG: DUF86 domain-containing protein [Acidobacteria bacterium]|jgi:uncharacterized protein YutE (UPF0331/DUF86 family)|nr:DUF86 domain-containing protein [Acidobacteriota bacterium]